MKEYPVGLIAIDLDGTLLTREKIITEKTVRTLMEAQEKGIVVCINTGRMAQDAYAMAQEYGLTCAVCGNNGAHIIDAQGKSVHELLIPPEEALELCEIGLESGLRLTAHYDGFVAVHPETSTYKSVSKCGLPCYYGYDEMVRLAAGGMRKIVMGGELNDPRLLKIRQIMAEKYPHLVLASSWAANVEINPKGAGKDAALLAMCKAFNVTLERTMALGDAENDLPALRIAGYSVAMGNASEEVKAICRFETKTNTEDGVAYAVRKWAMGEEA